MKIDILTSDGSQRMVTPQTVWGDTWQIGVGGAELALMTMCEEWTRRGDMVRLYNDPRGPNDVFEQLPIAKFDPLEERDILVTFRSPNPKAIPARGYRVWWSCDQYTNGSFEKFSKYMDKIVVISPFHAEYFKNTYAITDNVVVTDLPVRVHDYPVERPEKIKNRFLFSSVPERGLDQLWRMWPMICEAVPDASVVITSDYRLWGTNTPLNERHKVRWMAHDSFTFLGAVPRARLIDEQMKASIMAYPCIYDELFCIAVAEAQYAGIYPITTGIGALPTTNMGTVVSWNARDARGDQPFVDLIARTLNNPTFADVTAALQAKAAKRFHPDTILDFWAKEIFPT
jgi:glycosyltransferase involved in cell wall biosynthesis